MRRTPLQQVLASISQACAQSSATVVQLLAVSKTQSAQAVANLAAQGQRLFGENYVQEALAKQAELAEAGVTGLEWHLIGHLQSNKAKQAAEQFDWVQTVDRAKLVTALAQHRPSHLPPLNVLVQVNIDDEASKHGCQPAQVGELLGLIDAQPNLLARGLMAIPAPDANMAVRAQAFARMQALFVQHGQGRAQFDTLSMGMSQDFALAIAHGATMVRVGTALFGARPSIAA